MLIGLADFEEITHDRIVRFRAGIQRRIVAATRSYLFVCGAWTRDIMSVSRSVARE
jgi:hypothetical protein